MYMDMENNMKIQIDNEVLDANKEIQKIVTDAQNDALDYENLILSQIEAKEIQRQVILDRLGLTADEAKLLLG
jgi:hypothetical protein